MIRALLESIQEAAASLLNNTETLCGEEIADILSQEELQEMDTSLWVMVDMTQ